MRRFRTSGLLVWLVAACRGAALSATAQPPPPAPIVVDAFETVGAWSPHPADGVELRIGADAGAQGRAMRLDFDFVAGGGYAVARRDLHLDLPENYAFTFRIRGQASPNDLEFKLVDSTGANVWWSVQRDFHFPKDWDTVTIKRRHIRFAWGPSGGGEIRHVAALELAITAGRGGRGTVWIDELELRPLPPPGTTPPRPVASATSSAPGCDASAAVDGNMTTSWCSAPGDRQPSLGLDFQLAREFGGLVLDWAPGRHPRDYVVEMSDDGTRWRPLRAVQDGNGGRDALYMPESEARRLRVRALGRVPRRGIALRELAVQPLEWSASRETFFEAIARDAPRGSYPRAFSGEQVYWTVVGVDNDTRECLLDEDGRLETGKGAFSIEPFLFTTGHLRTWSDVEARQSLEEGSLPIPTVTWPGEDLELTVTAFGIGRPDASGVIARYRVRNRSARRARGTLYLALRPFQVNPPSQLLNSPGGTAPIHDLALRGRSIQADGRRAVVALSPPSRFGAATFDQGDIVADHLRRDALPSQTRAGDPSGAASGALAYKLDLSPGAVREVELLVPLHESCPVPPPASDATQRAGVQSELEKSLRFWKAALGRTTIELPDSAAPIVRSMRSQLAYILVNRAGAAIQPGARAYARSWIRDGALTSSALLRLGHPEPVRDFLSWFATFQYGNGKVPCCVDARGADPVPEHDSGGEFIFLVAEYDRYTGDRALAERLWPRVVRAAGYLDSLRQERRTAVYRAPGQEAFFGLLPPSISHEGYSAKPMHSYWDDLFALRGFRDAAWLAGELGHDADRARLAAVRDEFQHDLVRSLEAAMRQHHIDYLPGCADLGDFDATSTTIALSPVGAGSVLPQSALRRTFEKYWDFFRERRDGAAWEAFTPYEMRNIGACVRLGWRERAAALTDYFLASQRPAGWLQWAEVVWREPRRPKFIGDMPHTWVGSDFVRSVLDLFAYERDEDESLVLGAGIRPDWLRSTGVAVRRLRTPYGALSYTMKREGDTVVVHVEPGLRVPRGGILVRAPLASTTPQVTLDGRPATALPDGGVLIHALPATLVLRP